MVIWGMAYGIVLPTLLGTVDCGCQKSSSVGEMMGEISMGMAPGTTLAPLKKIQ